jgi:hypothetical protein
MAKHSTPKGKRKAAKASGAETPASIPPADPIAPSEPETPPTPPRGMLNPENVAEAIMVAGGNVNAAAATLGCHAATVRKYIAVHEVCADAATEAREIMIDESESALLALVCGRDRFTAGARVNAAKYILDAHGKARGYGKAVAINGNLDLGTWTDAELIRLAQGESIDAILRDRTNANSIPHAGTIKDTGSGGA